MNSPSRSIFIILASMMFLVSCVREEDPGPLQLAEEDFPILDFDRLDVGEDFVVSVRQGLSYSVHARGDRRNLDDVAVTKVGTTLKINYAKGGEHKHQTFITITMPSLSGGHFSGACNFTIAGFTSENKIDLFLSGASVGQLNGESPEVSLWLSGASRLSLSGKAGEMTIHASGASELEAFAMLALRVQADASGASRINVLAVESLDAVASGASAIYYRGKPLVNSTTSGAAIVSED